MSMIKKRAALERVLCSYFKWFKPRCMLCNEQNKPLRLHHLLRRSIYMDKSVEEYMPLVFYSLLCDQCNNNEGEIIMDNPFGRAFLLAKQANAFGGLDVIRQSFDKWNTFLPNGHNNEIVSFETVKSLYEHHFDASK